MLPGGRADRGPGKMISLVITLFVCIVNMSKMAATSTTTSAVYDPESTAATKAVRTAPYMCYLCRCYSWKHRWFIDCSGRGLYFPPRNFPDTTEVIKLSRNRIRTIQNFTFKGLVALKILDLSFNRIDTIHIGSFDSLVNLEWLQLQNNVLVALYQNLKPGLFSSLAKLKALWLNSNASPYFSSSIIPDKTFADLSSLEYLVIDGYSNMTFGPGFRNLTKLVNVTMTGLRGRGVCTITTLLANTFQHVPHLEHLEMTGCSITNIHPNAFSALRNLNTLDLSWNNNLGFKMVGIAMQGLVGSALKVLKTNSVHSPYRAGSELMMEDMLYIKELNLTEWYLDLNGLEYIDNTAFGMFPPNLRILTMRYNRLHFGVFLNFLFDDRNPNIEIYDAGEQDVAVRSEERYYRLLNRRRKPRDTEGVTTGVVLKRLICSGSRSDIFLLDFTNMTNNLTYMDISRNFIPELKSGSFNRLHQLMYLNLSGNYIEFCEENAFTSLSSLKILDLQNNLMGYELEMDKNGHIFRGLENLQHLNVSQNRITKLQRSTFESLTSLQTLILSENYIEKFDVNLENSRDLAFLDLSNNRLQELPHSVRKVLDRQARGNNATLDLSDNRFLCNCQSLPFIEWLRSTPLDLVQRETYYCSLNNGTTRYLNESDTLIGALKTECRDFLPLILGCTVGGTFVIALSLSYVTYRNRWKLRYMYYMAKLKLDIKPNQADDNYEYEYDLFVSYADENRGFVIGDMREELETKNALQMNIRDRDFELGEVNAINISKAIRKSRKTVLLLSPPFLKNKWCDFELNMARMEAIHMKREVLILVFKENVPVNELTLSILDLLRSSPNLECPEQQHLQPVFWDKLVEYIKQ